MAGHLKLILDTVFPKHWDRLMKLAGEFRRIVQERWGNDLGTKNACYERFLDADWKTLLKEKKDPELKLMLEDMTAPVTTEPDDD